MNRKTIAFVILGIFFAFAETGCVSTLIQTSNAVTGVRNVLGLYEVSKTFNMVKDIEDIEPIFADFEYAMIDVKIAPRDEKQDVELVAAFKDNFFYLVKNDLEIVEIPLTLCEEGTCPGNTVTIQFKESAYDENFVQKVALGTKLRGNLYYIDSRNDTVIDQVHLENAGNYEDLINMIHVSVLNAAIKSTSDKEHIKTLEEEGIEFDPVKPEYKELFQTS